MSSAVLLILVNFSLLLLVGTFFSAPEIQLYLQLLCYDLIVLKSICCSWEGSRNKPNQCSVCVCVCFSVSLMHGPPSVHRKYTWIFYPPTPGLTAAKAATFLLVLLPAISHPFDFSGGSQTLVHSAPNCIPYFPVAPLKPLLPNSR